MANSIDTWNVPRRPRDTRWPVSSTCRERLAIPSAATDRLTKPGFEAEPAANVIARCWNAIVLSGRIERPPEGGYRVPYDAPARSANLREGAGLLIIGNVSGPDHICDRSTPLTMEDQHAYEPAVL